jgi:6-hydroxymethylpterin diphosphokinase MptE-like
MFEKLRPFVPPRLWPYGYRLYTLSQYLKLDGFRDLRRNRELAGRFSGRRAFVVGNGSSLKRMDLTPLKGEHLITVNSFFRYAAGFGLTPLAHVFLDPAYAKQLSGDLAQFAALRDPSTLVFAHLEAREVVRRHLPDAYYLFTAGSIDANRNLDISRPIPSLQTVTLAALLVALHLGFGPIYLIGCDMDYLSNVQSVSPLKVTVPHFYDDEIEVVSSDFQTYPDFVQAIWRMFEGYRRLHDLLAPGQAIYNAGVGGLLDAFPRVDFKSLF